MKFLSIIFIALSIAACSAKKSDVHIKLEREIEKTFTDFSEKNNGFIFDVAQGEAIFIQAVHTSFLDTTSREDESFGFGITMAFDVMDDGEFENQQKFEKSLYHDEFIYYDYDGVMCYILDIDGNPDRGAKIMANILLSVYGINDSTSFEVNTYNQGKIEKRENSK